MKKLSVLLVAGLLVVLSSTSCKKCKDCEQTSTTTGGGILNPQPTSVVFEACDDDLKDVDGKTTVVQVGNLTITTKTTCK